VVENALPTLVELGMRATVFLPIGAIDRTHRFTWYERQPPLLEWSTITELDRGQALEFGAHTIGHTNLLALHEDDAAREIGGSKQALEDRLGHPVTAFCYPSGLYGERELRLVRTSGFQLAVGAEPGANGPNAERLALRRIGIGPRDRLLDFRAKVGGGHDSAPPLRATYRAFRFGMPRSASSRS
jgi:peptidoglycan/xylan/chitin deacetylase (PgdA/CDA1 family)